MTKYPNLIMVCAITALLAPAAAAGPSGLIGPSMGSIFRPVASGDWIAWAEMGTMGLYAQNAATGERRTIVEPRFDPVLGLTYGSVVLHGFAPWHPQIAMDGTSIIWSDRRHGTGGSRFRIYSYDLATGVESLVGPSPSSRAYGLDHVYPSVSGGRVVWQGGGWRVMHANVDGSGLTSFGGGSGALPQIAGDALVWSSGSVGAWIYHRDLTTSQTRVIFQSTELQNPRGPVTDGRYVAWSMRDLTSGRNIVSIMAYDLLTGELVTVLEHTGSKEHRSNVAISNGVVIWEDWRNNTDDFERYDLDVWGFDLTTRTAFPIATGPGNQHEPWINGDMVVWVDDSTGQRMIGWTLLMPEPGPGLILLVAGAAALYKRERRAGSRRR